MTFEYLYKYKTMKNSILLLLALLTLLLGEVTAQEKKKNVLFFAVDDLRTELGIYGHSEVRSPNIDSLASKSMVFERAYCQVAVCSPSRTSLLTGRRPDTNHVWKIADDEYWRNYTNATTIPQYFKDNGYISAGMGKIFHPGKPNGFDDEEYSWSVPYFHGKQNASEAEHAAWYSFKDAQDNKLRDGQISDKAIQTLQELKKNRSLGDDRPFFLAVGFHKPHLPFYAPSTYYDIYPPPDQIKPPANPDAPAGIPPIAWITSRELREYGNMGQYNLSECYLNATASINGSECMITGLEAQTLRRAYYACVSFTDAQVGKVIAELEAQGFANDTIIVLWADHGWQLGEHNMWGKFTNLEDGTHVPFLLRVPGVTDAGMRSKALVELIDIFPTLTELTGLQVPPMCPPNNKDLLTCVEGNSVVPLLKNPDQQWKKAAFSQYARPQYAGLFSIPDFPPFDPLDHGEDVMGYTARVDKYRFVEWYKFDRTSGVPDFSKIWGTELYDHTQPANFFNDENTNLATDPNMQTTVQELRKVLQDGWRDALPPN